MKKTLVLFLMICGISLTSNIQAKNLDNINGVRQSNNNQRLTETHDISESRNLNTNSTPLPTGLIILIVACFLLAKKHQSIATKHRESAKKH